MALPLAGITVVALEQAVAAPLCTARLADAGARVIKVERAEGDFARDYDHVVHGESAYFVWLNRGKQSIALDLKDPEDAALLARIAATADIFVQNLAPGAAARAGFDSALLREANPRLITVDISGYGDDGPYRDMKAYDLLVQCESGLASVTGGPEAPGRVGVSVADICCGMNAHAAVLQALYVRAQSGEGAGIAVSLFDGLADWMTVPLLHQDYGGKAPARVGLAHPSIAPYGEFQLPGDRSVVISVQNQREWQSLCRLLDREAWIDDPRFADNVSRCGHRVELDRAIEEALALLDPDVVAVSLKAAGIAFGFVNSVAEFSRHPQLRRVTVGTPTGTVEIPAPPVRWAQGDPVLGAIPAINADGAAIRAEFA
jgi:crotonobetainyl-CoA:carnitine CoA-transferase CaiB-like acyl-CoA transferase